MHDDVRYVGHLAFLRKSRDARVCRTSPEQFDHLSLGEIDRLTAETSHRQKLRRCGLKPTPEDEVYWVSLNRVPRRPPIYRYDDDRPKGAA